MNTSLRIALTLNTAWNAFNFRKGLLRALVGNGYDVVVIAPADRYVKELEKMGVRHVPILMDNRSTNPLKELALLFRFFQVYRDIAPDLILQYTIKPNIYGSIAAAGLGIPVICNISGLGTAFLDHRFSMKIARALYRISMRFPQKVFFQNPQDRDLFVNKGILDPVRSDLLPGSGIDTQRFAPAPTRESDGVVRFLLIARLLKDKGLVEYVDAARALKERYPGKVVCAVLGAFYPGNPTAVSQTEMADWIREGIIDYLGESDDVPSIIRRHDCIVLPSYREGLSRVLLEAASMAKPVVTTDVPGCRDVVQNGFNGLLCKPGDSRSLTEQMERIVHMNSQERQKMGLNGRTKVVAEFDEALVIQKYLSAIDEIVLNSDKTKNEL